MQTDEEIDNGQVLLQSCPHPKPPDSGDYLLDRWEENGQLRWCEKLALARLTGRPVPGWTYKASFGPFRAYGPPGWENLPEETVWDRLQYMWVLPYSIMNKLQLRAVTMEREWLVRWSGPDTIAIAFVNCYMKLQKLWSK